MKKVMYTFALCIAMQCLWAQMDATVLIDKSIQYHDPKGNWSTFQGTMEFETIMADSSKRYRTVTINNKESKFTFSGTYKEGKLEYIVTGNEGKALWNGSTTIPDDMAKEYRIATDRAVMYRNYYSYLYGMPMKLKDPGTLIDPKVERVEFYGKEYYKVRVTYDPAVGSDIWYFYFDTSSLALEAYQFYKDESKNDGEYILFEEIKLIDGIKIPSVRHWYYNSDEKFLATDILK